MNRRLMMQQQNKGFELVYDAASGVFPDATGNWDYTYFLGDNHRKLENNLLIADCEHLYAWQRYIPISHPKAKNCEFNIAVEGWQETNSWTEYSAGIFRICLADENNFVAVKFDDTGVGAWHNFAYPDRLTGANNWQVPHKKAIKLPQNFTARIVKYEEYAEVYLNDELVLLVPTLFADDTQTNFISFGTKCTTNIKQITYKEW